jgi:hypothetical protein
LLYCKLTCYVHDIINWEKFVVIVTRQRSLLQFVKTGCPLSLVSSEHKGLIGRVEMLATIFQLILGLTMSVIMTVLPQRTLGFYALNRDNFTFLFMYDNNNIYLYVKILCYTILGRVLLPRSTHTLWIFAKYLCTFSWYILFHRFRCNVGILKGLI